MSRDYSEYKASKYDEYLKARMPINGSVLSVLDNRAKINCDKQTVEILTDYTEEYFMAYDGFSDLGDDFNRYFQTHKENIYKISELISDTIDYEKIYESRQNLNAASGKITFEFLSEERIMQRFYYGIEGSVVYPKINIFCDSTIKFDLAEGLFDFIYADFETPLNYLINIYESNLDDEIFYMESHKIYSKLQQSAELLLDYDKTVALIKPLLYASIYSGICPPRFDFEHNFLEQLKWYGNYLISLQKEYKEMIQFCFDEEYYPDFFLGANKISKYYLYRRIKGLPNSMDRTEKMLLTLEDANGIKKYRNRYFKKNQFMETVEKENIEFLKGSTLNKRDICDCLYYYLNITENYVFGRVDEILELEFTKMLNSNVKIKKCKRCGKYFRLKGNYHTDYCSRIAPGEGRNCREIAATDKYKSKTADNRALQIYNKYYKRYMARVKVNQIKEEKFKDWQFDSLSMRDACERGSITIEEYIEFNESYFPNRKPKDKK